MVSHFALPIKEQGQYPKRSARLIGGLERRRNQGLKTTTGITTILSHVATSEIRDIGPPGERCDITVLAIQLNQALCLFLQLLGQPRRTDSLQRMSIRRILAETVFLPKESFTLNCTRPVAYPSMRRNVIGLRNSLSVKLDSNCPPSNHTQSSSS